ncbi:PIG-L family deacetylase [Acidipropionibacterium virtanenii]|uniref:Putative N-acetyl-alpha-D-glucosaminyl L-malate deacetylase 2 n=1 Tax=Acidipropionibacterium virtanenii TaxID=2057246 RepID=A0A344UWM8_9ACTN|nr:PIG-L family deacetylase [Acidipropionibacterium virtanenii]AXE39676.1 putative N-acetyl-alpha-D-glucosaminyl L-malate deacetylase 2 [Acidipropionibacterium virtanenii]
MSGAGDLTGRTVLAVHPGAEMFGSDRMFLESVTGMVEGGARVVAALPMTGPLVARLEGAGASVVITRAFVLRKALMRPSGWPQLLADLAGGTRSALRLIGRVRPDAIYVSTIIEPLWPPLGRLHQVPVVSHVHEAERSLPVAALLYGPHALSTQVILNSRFTAGAFARVLPGPAHRARILLNGVEGPQDPPPPRPAIDGTLRLVYVGRLSPRKGPDLLLDVAQILADQGIDVNVTLVGDVFSGYEWYAEELRAKAEGMDVPVEFAGFEADVWPRLAAADILAVPSRADESFGNAVVEGVLALRPVVASDMSGLREAAEGYPTTRLVPACDAHAVATGIQEICDDWPAVVAAAPQARAEARRRLAPQIYRAGVRAAIATAVDAGRPGEEPRMNRSQARTSPALLATAPRRAAKTLVRTVSSTIIGALGVDATSAIAGRPTLVITPHPDDETFGCGATIARIRAGGTPVQLLVVSDGADSPRPDGVGPEAMIGLRRQETIAALAALGVDESAITFWDFPDGSVEAHRAELTDRVAGLLTDLSPEQVMVTSAHDRHPDHAVAGMATREAVARLRNRPRLLEYPIWQRIPAALYLRRGADSRISGPLLCRADGFREQKRAAVAAYQSQLPHFPAGWVEDFLRPFEHFTEVRA